jgi:hypothetical protein
MERTTFAGLPAVALWSAIIVCRDWFPLRKQRAEGWNAYFLRIYMWPVFSLITAAAGVAEVAGVGPRPLALGEYALFVSGAAILGLAVGCRSGTR